MNRRVARWLYKKAEEILGEEELESLKNDLVEPVKIAAKDAAADLLDGLGTQDDSDEE